MADFVEQLSDVELQNPIDMPAPLSRRSHGIQGRLPRPVAIGVRAWRIVSGNAGHVPVTRLRLGSDNDGEGAMTPKNIALEPDLLEQVGKLAQEEGKTADEL